MRKVYRLIRQLGMTSKYKGYYYVAEAVMMSMELQDYPIKITKDIYPYLAKKFKSTPVNIEHDIRTVINVCWTANKETMDRIAAVRSTQAVPEVGSDAVYSDKLFEYSAALFLCEHVFSLSILQNQSDIPW